MVGDLKKATQNCHHYFNPFYFRLNESISDRGDTHRPLLAHTHSRHLQTFPVPVEALVHLEGRIARLPALNLAPVDQRLNLHLVIIVGQGGHDVFRLDVSAGVHEAFLLEEATHETLGRLVPGGKVTDLEQGHRHRVGRRLPEAFQREEVPLLALLEREGL